MKSFPRPSLLVVFLSTGLFAQEYQIQIHRPMKAGEKYNVECTASQSQDVTTTSNGVSVKDTRDEFSASYKSVEQVLAVDAIGRETKTSSTLEKLSLTEGGVTRELLPAGTVVVSSISGHTQIHEVNGQSVDPDVAKVLNMVISLSKGGPGDDEAVGTKDRKKIGETWDADGVAIQNQMDAAVGGKAEAFSGKGTLVDVIKGTGGDVLKINGHITGKIEPPLPDGFMVDSSEMTADLGGSFPVNLSLGRPKDVETISFSFTAHAASPSGGNAVLKVKTDTSLVHTQTRL